MEGCLGSLSSEEARRYLAGILIWNEVYRKSMGRDAVMDKKGKRTQLISGNYEIRQKAL